MDSSFGALDAFAFVVFAVLIFAGVVIVVSLGAGPARTQMGASAGRRDQRHELDRNCDGWVALADRVHLGVHDAVRNQI